MSLDLYVGIDNIDKLSILNSIGIKNIFCGYVDKCSTKKWPEEFCILNKRGLNCNIVGKKHFKEFALKSAEYGISIYITFNGLYTDEQYDWILSAINMVSSFSAVKGVIISDIGLLLRLKTIKYSKEIVISTGGMVFNSSAVSFYKQFNINKVILNRQMKSDEIINILETHKYINVEIFLLFGNCMFIDGYCSLFHKTNLTDYGIVNCRSINYLRTQNKYKIINNFKQDIKNYDIKYSSNDNYHILGCNLCIVRKLQKYSNRITYKLITRSNYAHEFDRLKNLLTIIKELDSNKFDIKNLFYQIFGCKCDGYGCYISDNIV